MLDETDLWEEPALPPTMPGGRDGPPVWQSLHGAYHSLRIRVRQALADVRLEASEACVLVYVTTSPGCSPGELRRALGIHRSTLSSMLTRLEVEGLIERGAPPFDHRRLLIDVTPKGRRLSEMASAVLLDVESELVGWLTPQERRAADSLFAACQALLRPEEFD